MKQKMVRVPLKVFEELLEEVGILRNPEIMKAIAESDEAKANSVKTWDLNSHL